MNLERRTTNYGECAYTRFFGRRIETLEETALLAGGVYSSGYFFGAVQDFEGELSPFFGEGPNHDILKQMIQENTGRSGHIITCQIIICEETKRVTSVLFEKDPGKEKDNASLLANDAVGNQRRVKRIKALLRGINPDVCNPLVHVGWLGEGHHAVEYLYLPRADLLKKFPRQQ